MRVKKQGIYISYSFSKINEYRRLVDLINLSGSDRQGPFIYNYSCTYNRFLYSHRIKPPDLWVKFKITCKLKKTSLFLVLLGPYFDTSYWMQFEVKKAKKMNIPMIGIWIKGEHAASGLINQLTETINWDEKDIANTVKKYKPFI